MQGKTTWLEDMDGNPVKVVDGIAYTKELLDDIRREQFIHDTAGLNTDTLHDLVLSGINLIRETQKWLGAEEFPVPELLDFATSESNGKKTAEMRIRFGSGDPDVVEHQCDAVFENYRKFLGMIERKADIDVRQPDPLNPWSPGVYTIDVAGR